MLYPTQPTQPTKPTQLTLKDQLPGTTTQTVHLHTYAYIHIHILPHRLLRKLPFLTIASSDHIPAFARRSSKLHVPVLHRRSRQHPIPTFYSSPFASLHHYFFTIFFLIADLDTTHSRPVLVHDKPSQYLAAPLPPTLSHHPYYLLTVRTATT